MKRKLIISEGQINMLKQYINEADAQQVLIRKIVGDLDLNYEPTKGTYKKGGEFFEKPMVINKVNKEILTPKSLYSYIKYKYDLGDEFIKQIISDWFYGNLNNNKLSKNITIS